MAYIIDGYNLLHALGRLTPRSGQTALEGARLWLLTQLRQSPSIALDVTVVFDANAVRPGAPRRIAEGGILFVFATGGSADDLIEEMIAAERNPRQVTIVSDDRRLQHAGRRRGCAVLGCLDFYERCAEDSPVVRVTKTPEVGGKPEKVTPEEVREWLETFGEGETQGDLF